MTGPSIHRRRLMTIVFTLIALGMVWTTLVWADTAPSPTMKELIEKSAKESEPVQPAEGIQVPEDPFDRGVPRSSVHGYLTAARSRDYVKAAEYLDLRNLPPTLKKDSGPKLARQLKIVLDRVLWIDLDLLSTSPEGDQSDNLPAPRDRIGRISTERKKYDIFVQRVPRGDGVYIWQFAGATVADIPELYKEFGYAGFERIFPLWLFDVSFLGIHLWRWILGIGVAIAVVPVAMFISWVFSQLLRRIRGNLAEQFDRFFKGPVTLLIWTIIGRTIFEMVGYSVAGRALAQGRTIQMIGLAWLLMRLVDFAAERASGKLDRRGLSGARVILVPAARVLKLLAITAAALMWLDNVGYKVTTLLAGLSISGIAVALASQKSLENIFGAVTLFTAQPVKVGDFCRFGEHMGTVEEIGLRATRIRTLERSLITVPNSEFANMHLDNLSKRDRFWYHPKLALRYETTPDQIRYILVEVRKMLYAHPKVLPEPQHVRFHGFGEYSLDLEVFAYMAAIDYTESLEIAEDLHLRIMDIVSAAGSDFAFPSEIEYSLPGKPFDEKRAQAVGAEVKEWKARRTLYLPSFPKEKIAEVKGSLNYPSEGSPQYVKQQV
jgi:MscS family membrane protein